MLQSSDGSPEEESPKNMTFLKREEQAGVIRCYIKSVQFLQCILTIRSAEWIFVIDS